MARVSWLVLLYSSWHLQHVLVYSIVCCETTNFSGCEASSDSTTYSHQFCTLLAQECKVKCPHRQPQTMHTKIANVMHQMWTTSHIPIAFEYCVSTMLRVHPHWHYIFWDDVDLPIMFDARAKQIGRNFNDYGLTGIQNSDVARYLIVYIYGGFYADLDMEALKPLDAMLTSSDLILGQEPKAHAMFLYKGRLRLACNAIIGSRHSNAFWTIVLNNLKPERSSNAVATTGPIRLDDIITEFGYDSYVLPPNLFYPLIGPFAREQMRHYCGLYASLDRATSDPEHSLRLVKRMGPFDETTLADVCSAYVTGRRRIPNLISNESYTAHHWSHTNINKNCGRASQVDMKTMLESAQWMQIGDPKNRPTSRGGILDDRMKCPTV